VKIAPNGTITNLSKQGPVIGGMDRAWYDLIIDSKDNMYAHDGKEIYKIVVSKDNIVTLTRFAGQQWSYKLEDGPLATAGINSIGSWRSIRTTIFISPTARQDQGYDRH
jgi:hypothetical protein